MIVFSAHFGAMVVMAAAIATAFSFVMRDTAKARLGFGLRAVALMVGSVIVVGWLMLLLHG